MKSITTMTNYVSLIISHLLPSLGKNQSKDIYKNNNLPNGEPEATTCPILACFAFPSYR